MRRFFLLTFLSFFSLSCLQSYADDLSEKWRIISGIGVGPIILNKSSRDDVSRIYSGSDLNFLYDSEGIIVRIVIMGGDYKTSKSLKIGVSENFLIDNYGKGHIQKTPNVNTIDHIRFYKGISFTIYNKIVTGIMVFKS